MKEELTTKMHSEFSVDSETEILHRCITLWCYAGGDEAKAGLRPFAASSYLPRLLVSSAFD